MNDTPKFEVIDRRKYKADEEERETAQPEAAPQESAAPAAGPRLVEDRRTETAPASMAVPEPEAPYEAGLPPAPTAEESHEQKKAYDASSQRLEDLVRAQNPGMGPQPPVTFENLAQQLYLSAMIQMGAGAAEGQRPRVDILGAKQTIDLMGVLAEKTKGNLTAEEDRVLQSVLFEVRMAFLELTNMITLQSMQPPPPPAPGKR